MLAQSPTTELASFRLKAAYTKPTQMHPYSRDLDDNDRISVQYAAREGLTAEELAAQMNLHPLQIQNYLAERGNERLRDAFIDNKRRKTG